MKSYSIWHDTVAGPMECSGFDDDDTTRPWWATGDACAAVAAQVLKDQAQVEYDDDHGAVRIIMLPHPTMGGVMSGSDLAANRWPDSATDVIEPDEYGAWRLSGWDFYVLEDAR